MMTKSPLYLNLAEAIMDQIESGKLVVGTRLPSERALANTFNINRQTVRQGLEILINRGLIEKVRGSGRFVAPPRLERSVSEFMDFSERMKHQGYSPSAAVMAFERLKPSEKVAGDLGIARDADVFRFHRIRTINRVPVVLEAFTISADLVPGIEQFDLNARSFYEILKTEYQIHIAHSRQSLEAVILSEMEAQWLQTESGSPAMLERRLAFDRDDRAIESGTDLYRGDRVRFNSTAKMSVAIVE